MALEVLGWLILIVGLLISVAIHELGHLLPAKRFGVRVSEYFVGFGPTLFSRQRGETEYGVKAIPLGGYVRLVGMIPPADEVKPVSLRGRAGRLIADARDASALEVRDGEESRAFYRLDWWKKVIVMFGGPFTNLVLAALLFTVVLTGFGTPQQTLTVRELVACVPASGTVECTPSDPISPAVAAGVKPGDTIVSADGMALGSWTDLTSYVADRPGEPVTLIIDRDGEQIPVVLTPAPRERAVLDDAGQPVVDTAGEPVVEEVGFMGIFSTSELERQPALAGVQLTGQYLAAMAPILITLPVEVWEVGKAALGLTERDPAGLMGLIGVGRTAGEITSADVAGYGVQEKFADMLMLLGGLNLALFAFNMIPLVPLDGGHIASAVWQAIKNGWARLRGLPMPRPVDVARMMPLAYSVFGILIVMTVILFYADIVAPVRLA
jgi:membrane-associated protease RseP (regulator of RpoE activity)